MIKLKKNIFSAIQPSGNLTLGNYIGAIKQWIDIHKNNNFICFFCIADLHALTIKQSSFTLKKNVLDIVAIYLAFGIDPKKSIIFLQSHLHEHVQLYWLLTCHTYYGELNRMTQFKNKSVHNVKNINAGLFNYPILMAADILLYDTYMVPVGYDQIQHIELVCKIAHRINNLYKQDIFTIPRKRIVSNGSKILSLSNPLIKMSKSDSNSNGVIFLLDNIDNVANKIKLAVTDSDNPPKIVYDMDSKLGISNLLTILSNITDKKIIDLEKDFLNKSYKKLKLEITDVVCEFISKFQKLYFSFRQDENYLKKILHDGANSARLHAQKSLKKVKSIIGLI